MAISFLVKPLSESLHRTNKNEQSENRHRSQLRPQDIYSHPFQKDPPNNDQEIPKGIQIRQPLYHLGHIGYGKDKPTQHEKGQNKKECRHHSLLLGCRYR